MTNSTNNSNATVGHQHFPCDLDLSNSSILVTGGTGSFGKAFIQHILANHDVRRLAVISRDEQKQYEMDQRLAEEQRRKLRFFIGDVRDRERLNMAMRGVDYVIHAAAMKIVPTAEYNPFECIQTNVIGAENIAQAAIQNGVKRVIALSTDKAANPINLYGASKLASDKIFVAANHLSGEAGTRFSVVRYGNVMGSRGSVLPLYQRLIREGATTLPITDERMTRFWISLPQGIEFVLSCLDIMRGGEVFVPKIPSMRISDLAKALAPELPHKIIGIRPGEKLHEIMITVDDARNTVDLGDRYVIEPETHLWDQERQSFSETGGELISPDFSYTSDNNSDWMTKEDLLSLLDQAGKTAQDT
jgi:UDP-N-acetylglucosamine 4,6-dehydratase/5-epimerase